MVNTLKPGSHIHLMGICGTAMASLAGLLKAKGYTITGSDSNPYPPMSTQIESLGIQIQKPYAAENLNPRPDFVIVGNVISANNPEAQELVKLKIPFSSLPVAMGEWIIGDKESMVVAGTHGKTTTTSILAWIAEICGKKPGFLIGGVPKNFSYSFRLPEGNYFVIEGDEYDTAYFDKVPKFVHYKPRHVILTSIEFDHADIYKDLEAVMRAFEMLMDKTSEHGELVYWAEDKNIEELLKRRSPKKVYSYGFSKGDFRIIKSNYSVENIPNRANLTQDFSIQYQGKNLGDFSIALSGDYNLLNAAACVALAYLCSWPMDLVKQGLKSFSGVKRRQEVLGEPRGILVIEDFAHHPTAVRETLKGIQQKYQGRKIFAVFEPRSATSRRKIFQKEYGLAFESADVCLIADAFDQTKIASTDRFSSAELVADLVISGKTAICFSNVQEIVSYLIEKSKAGDLILIMSNGGFDGIYQKLLQGLESWKN